MYIVVSSRKESKENLFGVSGLSYDSLANVLASIVGTGLFWIIAGITWYLFKSRGNAFKKFFLSMKKTEVLVYLSNVSCSKDHEKTEAVIISGKEFESTNIINEMFKRSPFSSADIIRGLVDSFWMQESPLPVFRVSRNTDCEPAHSEDFDKFNTLIVVGSTNKNSIRRYFLKMNSLKMKLKWENDNVKEWCDYNFFEEQKQESNEYIKYFNSIESQQGIIYATDKYNIAILEKINSVFGNTIFMCVGVRADDSFNAVDYLCENWEKLHGEFGADEFAICIGTPFTKIQKPLEYQRVYKRLLTICRTGSTHPDKDMEIVSKEENLRVGQELRNSVQRNV